MKAGATHVTRWPVVRFRAKSFCQNSLFIVCYESCSVVSNSLRPHGLYSPWNSLDQNIGVHSLSLVQGIFPTQGSNPGLSHCRWILYQLSHKGSPKYWSGWPFLSPRDLSDPGIELRSSALQVDSLQSEPWRNPKMQWGEVKVAQSCPTLCDPMDYTVHEILQARTLEWVVFPFSRGSSQPRDWTQVSHIAGRFFTSWAIREAQNAVGNIKYLIQVY